MLFCFSAVTYSPCVLLLKNIHALGKDREGQSEGEAYYHTEVMTCY